MKRGALIIGGNVAGLQAAIDLADAGIPVHLVESTPFLGNPGRETIPEHIMNTRLLEVIRHPNIRIWTHTEIDQIDEMEGWYHVNLHQHPRYVDLTRCTACGACLDVCPVMIAEANHKAIYLGGQPGCMAIEKAGRSPCASSCPAGIHVQGYVALIARGRFQEAINLIRQAMPFPSVCGRVCNHQCEANCTLGQVDEPVNIMALKRFVADWEYARRDEIPEHIATPTVDSNGCRVAIIGAGPAGLTAARDLLRQGYTVTVMEALPIAGGMMRVGIPPHRLPSEYLDWEIQQVLDEGVELKLNTRVDDIPALFQDGYHAVLIATGAHGARKLSIRNCNHPDNWLSLDVLRRTCLGEKIDLSGKRVVVLGGGNVALDTARIVLRLGASEVRMACLEARGEMPGFAWEIGVAEEEGIEICPARTFHEIMVKRNKITGVRCSQVDFRGFKSGRPDMDIIPDTEHILPADIVIWAIGQGPDFSYLPQDGSINTRYPFGIQSDENMMTTLPGVFVAGDVHRGVTFFVVDAIGEGHRAARNIDRYLRGEAGVQEPLSQPKVTYADDEARQKLKQNKFARQKRVQIASIPLEDRIHNFREVDLTISESQAISEARRCLACGPCSECQACEQICQPGAICHDQQGSKAEVEVGAILVADQLPGSFRDLLPSGPGVHFLSLDDVLAASAASASIMTSQVGQCHPIPVTTAPALIQGAGRIGVFICQCGDRIANAVDTDALCELAAGLPNVVHAQVIPFSCSPDAAGAIDQVIQENQLDRAVLAACSCCSVNQVCFSCTYQRVRCKQNLGLFTYEADPFERVHPAQSVRFEFVNIREQCAWVHANNKQASTQKAMSLIAATVARVRAAPIRLAGVRPVEHSVLVLGMGAAGSLCQEMLGNQGIPAQSLVDLPDQLWRAGGQYHLSKGNQTWQASVLVLAPKNNREHNQLLARFGRERRRPEASPFWGGVETRRPGVFYCDPARDAEMVSAATAARVAAWLGRAESRPPIAAVVDPERCRACKTCIETCEYSAPELVEINGRRSAWIDPAMCRSCGTCAVHCPSGAITAGCSTDAQVQAMLSTILAGGATLK